MKYFILFFLLTYKTIYAQPKENFGNPIETIGIDNYAQLENDLAGLSADSLHRILDASYVDILLLKNMAYLSTERELAYSYAVVRAILTFDILFSKSKITSDDYYNIALIHNQIENYKKAIYYCTKSLDRPLLNHEEFQAYGLRGECKIRQEDFFGAIQDLSLAISKVPTNDKYWVINNRQKSTYYVYRGMSYSRLDKMDLALDDFILAISLNKKNSKAHYYKGLILINKNNKQEGCESLSRAGELGLELAYEAINKFCNK
jgi:tetratricopeptide (TPR) repeat protein